jgi:maltooligosyltrehalose trehalohydrolase
VRELLAVRRREIIPRLAGAQFGASQATAAGPLSANWQMGDGRRLSLVANLSGQGIAVTGAAPGTLIWGSELTGSLPPWTVRWRIE